MVRVGLATVVLLAVLISAVGHSEENQLADRARVSISNILYSPLSIAIENRLIDSGLSSSEIAHIIESAVDGYADCFVGFFESRPEKDFQEALKLLADGVDASEFRSRLGEAYETVDVTLDDHHFELEACFLDIQQSLGIPGDSLTNKD